MSKVRFCVEEDNPYSLERLEKVLGRDFWYREKNLRDALKEFIKFPDIENLIELLKFTPHAPVYDKKKLKDFQPNVLLITNEPGLKDNVIRSLYLRPAREVIEALYEHSGCIFGARTVLEEIIERFNRSMFSWLTLTPLRELGNKINGEGNLDLNLLRDESNLVYHFKKISYWIPNINRQNRPVTTIGRWKDEAQECIRSSSNGNSEENGEDCGSKWIQFLENEQEIKVIHWDLLPYAQYGEEKNDINDEIREIIEGVEQKNFQNIRNEIVSKASYKQSLWYVELLREFLNAFKVVDIKSRQTETGDGNGNGNGNGSNFFILVVGNRIIRDRDRREILGHLFAGLYEHNKDIKNAIVIFRDNWCSCKYKGNLYFVKFDKFLKNNNQNFKYFDWEKFKSVLNTISSYYGGQNKIPCR